MLSEKENALLREAAQCLLAELTTCAEVSTYAAGCLVQLRQLLNAAIAGRLRPPVHVPCGREILDTHIGEFPKMEEAYAVFSLRANGVDIEATKPFFDALDRGDLSVIEAWPKKGA